MKPRFLTLWVASVVLFLSLFEPVLSQTPAGKNVVLAWDPSPEPNIASYIIRYGTESGVYDRSLDAGNSITATLEGLPAEVTYYCAVFARNTSGIESAPSNEISFTTTAPAPLVNIVGLKSGDSWNAGVPIALEAETSADIARVEFYAGSTKLGEAGTSTSGLSWNGAEPGENVISAKGYNAANELVHSSSLILHVVKPRIEAAQRRSNGAFSFRIIGAPGRLQHVYVSTDLTSWTKLESALNETGEMEFLDDEAGAMTQRFYRVASE